MNIPKNILRDPLKTFTLDSYYGVISFYKWHKSPNRKGSWFHPIFYLLDNLKSKFPQESGRIDFLYRKTAYLNILEMEIQYLSDRFDWNKFNEAEEMLLSRFENLVTVLCETMIQSINLYEVFKLEKQGKWSIKRFEDIPKFLLNEQNQLPAYYHDTINDSINLSLYIYIRNSLVHNPNAVQYISNKENPVLYIENIPSSRRYGIFNKYIELEFEYYVKNLKGKRKASSCIPYIDDRFPYMEFQFFTTRKACLDITKTNIAFRMPILELSKKMMNDLFILQKDMFSE